MKKRQFIETLSNGDTVSCYFIVVKNEKRLTQAGKPYLDMQLQDRTGKILAKKWAPLHEQDEKISSSSIVEVEGSVQEYNGSLQMVVHSLRLLSDSEVEDLGYTDLLHSSPYNIDAMWSELLVLCREVFIYEPWYAFMSSFLSDPKIEQCIKSSAAAQSLHHAYYGGLLEHMLSVGKLCVQLAEFYPYLDKQVLVAGGLLHDIGKILELSTGVEHAYTTEGYLLGHIVQGIELITPYMESAGLPKELQLHIKHIILSHHGFLEYGSPKLPQTAEAIMVHYADNIDAKMQMVRQSCANVDVGGWSAKNYALGGCVYNPVGTGFFMNENGKQ